MQATRWTPSDRVASANSGLAAPGTEPRRQLGWYFAFAMLTTVAEALFLLSSMPSWMLG
jgi:hypothetical protein